LVTTRAKPTCSSPLYTPKIIEFSTERSTTSKGMPAAQYEVLRTLWTVLRSRREASVLMTYPSYRHSLRIDLL